MFRRPPAAASAAAASAVIGVVTALVLAVAVTAVTTAAAAQRLRLRVDAGLLTLDAEAVPLAEVVAAIGREAGFVTTLIGAVDTPVTLSLDRVPLADGLDRLLVDSDRVILYRDAPAAPAGRRIARLWLFGSQPGRNAILGPAPEPPDPLADADVKTRSEAVLGLVAGGASEQVVDTLGRILRDDPDALVRARAAIALGSLRDPRALAALEDALGDDHFSVRAQAIQALGQLGVEHATETLGRVLLYDPEARLRTLAARALHRDGSPLAQGLLDLAADDADPQVRSTAATSPAAVPDTAPPAAVPDDR